MSHSLDFKAPSELWNSPSKAAPGKCHGSGGRSKRDCLQDRANFYRYRAGHIILNVVTAFGAFQRANVNFLYPQPTLTNIDLILSYLIQCRAHLAVWQVQADLVTGRDAKFNAENMGYFQPVLRFVLGTVRLECRDGFWEKERNESNSGIA